MEQCFICEERRPEQVEFANAECTNCGRYVCYDHAIRVQRGSFLCLVCYEANEAFYRQHRRLIQRPRYNVPRSPDEHPNTRRQRARTPAPARRGLVARLRERLGL